MKVNNLFTAFFNSEKAGGLILIGCTIVSLLLANTAFGESYHHFWQTQFAGHSIAHWINDGLMTCFFLLIGLELEREIYRGELSNIKDALLPVFAAVGRNDCSGRFIFTLKFWHRNTIGSRYFYGYRYRFGISHFIFICK
ncbi:MAG: Na+/H+ antiporter NhaA [Ferruginibacter sp.]